LRKRVTATVVLALLLVVALASVASATIHPIVESFDCANEQAFAHHPLGDPADPPGATPGATPGQGNNELRAIQSVLGNNPDSPAAFGHKLDGTCGHAGG
jgi:hypothetical protein